jgi:hypothetical protein
MTMHYGTAIHFRLKGDTQIQVKEYWDKYHPEGSGQRAINFVRDAMLNDKIDVVTGERISIGIADYHVFVPVTLQE